MPSSVTLALFACMSASAGDAIHKSSHVFIGSALAAIITRVAVSACGGPALASYAASAIMSALLMGAISWWSVRLWRSHGDPADPMHGWLLLLLLPVKVAVSGLALARQWAMGFAVARAFLWILLPAPPLISGRSWPLVPSAEPQPAADLPCSACWPPLPRPSSGNAVVGPDSALTCIRAVVSLIALQVPCA